MGILAGIDIKFDQKIDVLNLIDDLLEIGWVALNYGGCISYLPVDDDRMFDWEEVDSKEWSSVRKKIEMKVALSELVGLTLTWKDSKVGGEFLFYGEESLVSFCVTVNRKIHDESRKTNYDWYLPKVVEPLKKLGWKISDVKAQDLE